MQLALENHRLYQRVRIALETAPSYEHLARTLPFQVTDRPGSYRFRDRMTIEHDSKSATEHAFYLAFASTSCSVHVTFRTLPSREDHLVIYQEYNFQGDLYADDPEELMAWVNGYQMCRDEDRIMLPATALLPRLEQDISLLLAMHANVLTDPRLVAVPSCVR